MKNTYFNKVKYYIYMDIDDFKNDPLNKISLALRND